MSVEFLLAFQILFEGWDIFTESVLQAKLSRTHILHVFLQESFARMSNPLGRNDQLREHIRVIP